MPRQRGQPHQSAGAPTFCNSIALLMLDHCSTTLRGSFETKNCHHVHMHDLALFGTFCSVTSNLPQLCNPSHLHTPCHIKQAASNMTRCYKICLKTLTLLWLYVDHRLVTLTETRCASCYHKPCATCRQSWSAAAACTSTALQAWGARLQWQLHGCTGSVRAHGSWMRRMAM